MEGSIIRGVNGTLAVAVLLPFFFFFFEVEANFLEFSVEFLLVCKSFI